MKVINFPFAEQFKDAMVSGKKVCTTRTKMFGQAGDLFEVFGAKFELVAVIPSIVLWVANYLYKQEGFQQPKEFSKAWQKVHPRLAPNAMVFVHIFKLVSSDK